MLICLIWRRPVHCTKAVTWSQVPFLSCSHHIHHFSLNPSVFEGETLNGVVRAAEPEVRTFLWAAAFVPWLATSTWIARLRPSAEQDSRTRPHQLPLLPASQTWYRHGALHCMNHSNSATSNWPTIEQMHERVTRPHNKPQYGEVTHHSWCCTCRPNVVLLLLLPPLCSSSSMCSSPLPFLYTVNFLLVFSSSWLCFEWN